MENMLEIIFGSRSSFGSFTLFTSITIFDALPLVEVTNGYKQYIKTIRIMN